MEKQLEKAEVLLRLTKDYLVPTEEYLMQAEVYLRSTREHLEAAETQLAPVGAPLMLTSKTVAGVLHPGELVEGHRGQGGRRGAQAGPAANRKGGPQGVVQMASHDRVPARVPPKGKVWSLQKRAWFPPRELGGRQRRHWRPQEQGAGSAMAQDADMTVPRGAPVERRMVREKQMAAERPRLGPPLKAPGRQSGGEAAGTGSGRRPERIEVRLSGNGGRVATLVCGE